VLRFTIDTNCIIDLEENNDFAPATQALVDAFRSERIGLAVPEVAAAERQLGGGYLESFAQFTARLNRLGLEKLELLPTIAYFGVSFYGHGYFGGDETMIALEKSIQQILHPRVEFSLGEFRQRRGIDTESSVMPGLWRNAKCDVQALWSHIHAKRDCFVTRDANFLKRKRAALQALGARSILHPSDAAKLLAPSV